jgi:hypothetical protein
MKIAFRVVALAVVCALVGCSKFDPRPTSAVATSDSVIADANAWVARAPAVREWHPVSDTGSMEPFVTSNSIVLTEKVSPTGVLLDGEVLVFDRGDSHDVLHVMTHQSATQVFMSGYNNRRSDGWFPRSAVKARMVGQLYLPR